MEAFWMGPRSGILPIMKQIVRWTAIVALFAIPFLPLYVASDLFFPYITGKNFAFRALVELALGAWILLALSDRQYRPRFSWTLAAFGGLVLWMIVANLLGVNPHKAFWSNFERMDGWVTLVHIFALYVVAGSLLSVEKLWHRWWMFFVSAAAMVGFLALLELGKNIDAGQIGVRLATTLGNPIYLGVYMMFAIFAALWLALNSTGWVRYALLAFTPLAGIVLFYSGSRGPLLGLVAGIAASAVLWLFLARHELKEKGRTLGFKVAGGSLLVLVVLSGSLFLARDSGFVKGNVMLTRAASVFSLNQELKVRGTIWSMALEGVAEDPGTGWGQEGFNQVFNKYYRPSMYAQEPWFDRAHNMYIDWLVAGGIPALALFLGMLFLGMLTLLRTREYSHAERVLLVGAIIAYAVQALVVFDNLFSYVPLVMLLAMAHAASAKPVVSLEQLPEARSDMAIGYATAGVMVVTLVVMWTVNVPSLRAANHLVYAISPAANVNQNLAYFKQALGDGSFATQEIREQLIGFAARVVAEPSVPENTRVEFAKLAIDEMGKEIEMSPKDARLRMQYSSAFDMVGDSERSLGELTKAVELSPRKQSLLLSRGFKLAELGRREEARADFRAAYELDRSFEQVAISTAAGYLVIGDTKQAKDLLIGAIGTTTPNNEALFYAYYQTKQWDELIGVAQARVTEEKGSAESRYRLAQAYGAAGRFEAARMEIAQTMAAFPSTRAQGEALVKQILAPAQ